MQRTFFAVSCVWRRLIPGRGSFRSPHISLNLLFFKVPSGAVRFPSALLVMLVVASTLSISSAAASVIAPQKLGDWPLFGSSNSAYQEGVEYTLKQPAFSDHAGKIRKIYLPLGGEIRVHSKEGILEYPVGTVVEKQFFYLTQDRKGCLTNGAVEAIQAYDPLAGQPTYRCMIETRLLHKQQHGWEPFVYMWDEKQIEARLTTGGGSVSVSLQVDNDSIAFNYQIPSVGECAQCHMGALGVSAAFNLIGPSLVRRLDLVGAKMLFVEPRLIAGIASPSTDPSLELQAREYLDINCAHCHNPKGQAASSALYLGLEQRIGKNFGFCKRVVASGAGYADNVFVLTPGYPLQSILVSRMSSNEPKKKMPELGRAVIDKEGVDLISKWISTLEVGCKSEG